MEIHRLILHTRQKSVQQDFYHDRLGFDGEGSQGGFSIITQKNILEFSTSQNKEYYHFAFLISPGTLESAILYLEDRDIEILNTGEGEKIMHFDPGRAIYFYDPDGNIVEFIERPELSYPVRSTFTIEEVIKINEIGFPVPQPRASARQLISQYGIQPENPEGFSDQFCWVGNADGVIITVKEGRPWLPVSKPGIPNEFKIEYTDSGYIYFLHIKGSNMDLLSKRPI